MGEVFRVKLDLPFVAALGGPHDHDVIQNVELVALHLEVDKVLELLIVVALEMVAVLLEDEEYHVIFEESNSMDDFILNEFEFVTLGARLTTKFNVLNFTINDAY